MILLLILRVFTWSQVALDESGDLVELNGLLLGYLADLVLQLLVDLLGEDGVAAWSYLWYVGDHLYLPELLLLQ